MRRGRRPHPELLTPREREVLACLREDLTNAEIGERLAISLDGVKYHVSEILAKLEVDSRHEAASWTGDPTAPRFGQAALRGAFGFLERVSIAKAVGVAVLGLTGLGFALLAFGVFSMDRREAGLGKIAYIYEGDVWVKELPDGDAKRLTTGGFKSNPQWSGDGEWLSYQDGTSGFQELHVMRADGTGERFTRRAAAGGEAEWSPRGSQLAYLIGDGQDHSSLGVENADGSRMQIVALSDDDKRIYMSQPMWSPDGKEIAFVRSDGYNGPPPFTCCDDDLGLWVVRPDGTGLQEIYNLGDLIAWGRGVSIVPITWTSDGSAVFYAIRAGQNPTALRSVRISDGETKEYNIPVASVGSGLGGRFGDYANTSADGPLAVVAGSGTQAWTSRQIIVVDPTTGVSPVSTGGLAAISPAWSPDGDVLAFVAQPDVGTLSDDRADKGTNQRRIWLWEGNATLRRLTQGEGQREELPQWSLDGRHLIYISPSAESGPETTRIGDSFPPAVVNMLSLEDQVVSRIAVLDTYSDYSGSSDIPAFRTTIERFGHSDWSYVLDWWQPPAE